MAFLHIRAAPNTALHLTAYSLRFAARRSGFRQQVSLGVRLQPLLETGSIISLYASILSSTITDDEL